ncbi:MAG: hypothetical protein ACI4PF_06975 [Christensenellales bacterium]
MISKEKIDELKEILPIIKEFPENLHTKIFDYLLKDELYEIQRNEIEHNNCNIDNSNIKLNSIKKVKRKSASSTNSYTNNYTPTLIKDLNLKPSGNKSLAEFFEEKRPDGNIQNSAVMTYYLQHILGLEEINPDHIFTCYRELNKKIPAVIVQNLRDCSSNRYGYINFNNGKITTSIKGINFVEQDLPHNKDSNK